MLTLERNRFAVLYEATRKTGDDPPLDREVISYVCDRRSGRLGKVSSGFETGCCVVARYLEGHRAYVSVVEDAGADRTLCLYGISIRTRRVRVVATDPQSASCRQRRVPLQ